jgi:hypothetical protein
MIIFLSIVLALSIVFILFRGSFAKQFDQQVKDLFNCSPKASPQIYTQHLIVGLPDPVNRYFKHVLKEGQPYIQYIRAKHDGQFKTGLDKAWVNIKGEQYATTVKPGLIWKGTTNFFVARDIYLRDKGRLTVSLFAAFKIIDGKGPQYDQGELIRWLGESVLYPTNLLPGERLSWTAIDHSSARFEFRYIGLTLSFIATFNDLGEITQLETKRYMDKISRETWIIKVADYKLLNEVWVPTKFEVLWRLKTGDFSYAKFNITSIEYNIAERF